MAVLITFALMADQIILLWFGPTWTEIIPYSVALPRLALLICGVPDLSGSSRCRPYPGYADLLVNLATTFAAVIFVASFFGRSSRRGFRAFDVAISGGRCALLRQQASRNISRRSTIERQ